MYAVVRVNTWDQEKLAGAADDMAEFDRIHAEQPGFLGSLVVDLGGGRHAAVNLWESEARAMAALPVVAPVAGKLLGPLMAEDSLLVGAGEVIGGVGLVRQP